MAKRQVLAQLAINKSSCAGAKKTFLNDLAVFIKVEQN